MSTANIDNSMQSKKERMHCMEILGGNLATNKAYEAVGLDVYVHSSPYLASQIGGGDVYYLTSCASGRISRLLLADISGHGEDAAVLAGSLKTLLQENVNKISQSSFVQQMNREFLKVSQGDRFATAVVATYFEPQKRLALGMAGHPNPLLFRSVDQRWYKVDEHLAGDDPRFQSTLFRNMPLGIVDDSAYPTRNFRVEPGDMFLLYSDAFVESVNFDSSLLGVDGVLELLNGMVSIEPKSIVATLQAKIRSLDPKNLDDDDATLILGKITKSKSSLKDTMVAPFKMFGNVTDKTCFEWPCCKGVEDSD